jgi:hypothetical protein
MKRKAIDADIIHEVIVDLDLDSLSDMADVSAGSNCSRAPVAVPTARPSSRIWLPKAALASLALLAISGATIQSESKTTVFAKVVPPPNGVKATSLMSFPAEVPHTPSATAPPSAVPKTQPDSQIGILAPPGVTLDQSPNLTLPDHESRIVVAPGLTLYQICAETLGTCHLRELNEIRRLNPWLTNPDHLESGWELRLPSQKELSVVAPAPTRAPVAGSVEVTIQ